MNKRRILLVGFLFAALLAGCGKTSLPEETVKETLVESVTMVVTEDTIAQLEEYPGLKRADLTGSTCYDAIEAYVRKHPDVEVVYTVALGGVEVSPDTDVLTLKPEEYTFEALLENGKHLPKLTSLTLPETDLTGQQLTELQACLENTALVYTVCVLDREFRSDAEELDLSGLTPEQVEEAAQKLEMLPNAQRIQLMKEDGTCALKVADVALLQQAAPQALFLYTFDLFGKTVSTTDERVEFKNKKLGDSKEQELRQALDIMKGCKYMLLECCYFTDPVLAQLREDYRDQTKIVWRIFFARAGSCLTDRTVLRYVYNVYNSSVKQLQYCEDVEYIDFGHNESLSDWSWVANMPKLKAIIVSGSIIRDLTPFAACESLEFLELSNCGLITDISPLSACKNLKRLNISYTKVEDLSALDDLPLECFVYVKPKAPQEELDRFVQLHPDCLTSFEGNEYGYPWRYTEDGDPNEYYQILKDVFQYPNATDTRW